LPDEYFATYDSRGLPTENTNCFLYFSKIGYEALKEDIKKEFLSRYADYEKEQAWERFESEAQKHFSKCDNVLQKEIKKLEKKLGYYKNKT
jgi:hypothetical protein